MKYDFLILGGAGMQARIAARDLLESGYTVCLADIYKDGANAILKKYPKTSFEDVDLRLVNKIVSLLKKIKPSVVINCAEGDWNINVFNACLSTKHHVLDLGSEIPITKKQLAMHNDFKRQDLIALTGCGSTPGVTDIMLGHASKDLDEIHAIEGGYAWTSNIKKFVVPFSIQSIIEEFTYPAAIIKNGKWTEIPAMSQVMQRDFRAIGNQEAIIVHHPETFTYFKSYKNKGLKDVRFYASFPPHSMSTIKTLIELNLGSKDPVILENKEVTPIDVLTQTLKRLPYPKGYTEQENLWIHVEGKKKNKKQTVLMECIVNTLPGWEDAGCNIDTGMPISIIAQMIKKGDITARGSYSPGKIVPAQKFFSELRKRSMAVYQNGTQIN